MGGPALMCTSSGTANSSKFQPLMATEYLADAFQRLFSSNDVPSSAECQAIDAAIIEKKAEFTKLEKEITRLQSARSALRRFPAEMLSEIFLHCRGSGGCQGIWIHKQVIPLVVSSVCQKWRNAALATPALWSIWTFNSKQVDIFNLWAGRSGCLPMEVHFREWRSNPYPTDFVSPVPLSVGHLLTKRLLQTMPRWKKVTIFGESLYDPGVKALARVKMPLLESVFLDLRRAYEVPIWARHILRTACSLHTLDWNGPPLILTEFPFSNLRTLSIYWHYDLVDGSYGSGVPPHDFFAILHHLPFLEDVGVFLSTIISPPNLVLTEVVHRGIRSLSLRPDAISDLEPVLTWLTCPELKSLDINYPAPDELSDHDDDTLLWPDSELDTFLSRCSSQLTKVAIRGMILEPSQILALLLHKNIHDSLDSLELQTEERGLFIPVEDSLLRELKWSSEKRFPKLRLVSLFASHDQGMLLSEVGLSRIETEFPFSLNIDVVDNPDKDKDEPSEEAEFLQTMQELRDRGIVVTCQL
ncbi:hypothetical protein C8J56DRAFT_931774 [Mycena floridula]|nr:hypothetical protein C8J56DRAFT_931774 [Mycena floridula]